MVEMSAQFGCCICQQYRDYTHQTQALDYIKNPQVNRVPDMVIKCNICIANYCEFCFVRLLSDGENCACCRQFISSRFKETKRYLETAQYIQDDDLYFSNGIKRLVYSFSNSRLEIQRHYDSQGLRTGLLKYNENGVKDYETLYNSEGKRVTVLKYRGNGTKYSEIRVNPETGMQFECVKYESDGINETYKIFYQNGLQTQKLSVDKQGLVNQINFYLVPIDGKNIQLFNNLHSIYSQSGKLQQQYELQYDSDTKINFRSYNDEGILILSVDNANTIRAYHNTEIVFELKRVIIGQYICYSLPQFQSILFTYNYTDEVLIVSIRDVCEQQNKFILHLTFNTKTPLIHWRVSGVYLCKMCQKQFKRIGAHKKCKLLSDFIHQIQKLVKNDQIPHQFLLKQWE